MYNSGRGFLAAMTIQITPSQLEIYRHSAREREAKLRIQLGERQYHAWEIARQAARILKEEFGASRVVVFGSLLHPELFHLRSDIDLGVWDIQDYFRAVSRLMDIDPEIEFDLVPVEDARSGILAVIRQEGVDL
jgi:predicted nucleotidyltransferase